MPLGNCRVQGRGLNKGKPETAAGIEYIEEKEDRPGDTESESKRRLESQD